MWSALGVLAAANGGLLIAQGSAPEAIPPWVSYLWNFGMLGVLVVLLGTRRLVWTAEMKALEDNWRERLASETESRKAAQLEAIEARAENRLLRDKNENEVIPLLRDVVLLFRERKT